MCNFYGTIVDRLTFFKLKKIEKELGTIAAFQELEKMKDGFKYSNALIIRKSEGVEDVEVVSAHWEFIPPWIKNEEELKAARKQKIPWLNARSETILSSKMFRPAALKRRCLVLATHFFEWRHYKPDGAKKPIAYPYHISTNEGYFYMAGIWQPWVNKDTGEVMDTFAIITTEANEVMAEIHNTKKRMPTILPEDLAHEWIMDEEMTEARIQAIASYQLPSENIKFYTIAKDFKIAEDPLAPFEYAELPPFDVAI